MLNKIKTILFFEKNFYIFLFLLIISLLIILIKMLSLVSIASFASMLSGMNTFFYKIFGISYNFKLNTLLIFVVFVFLSKN
jgi:hypothetical protein